MRKYRIPVVITKKGRPVAKLVPPDEPARDTHGCMAGTATILGDVESLTPSVAVIATQFPADFPGDPADRLIAATARVEGVPLVTRDGRLRASSALRTIW